MLRSKPIDSIPIADKTFDDLGVHVQRLISAYKGAISRVNVLEAENAELRRHLSPRPEAALDATEDGEGRG